VTEINRQNTERGALDEARRRLEASLLEQDEHESYGHRERSKPEDAHGQAAKSHEGSEARPSDGAKKEV
jgi:hypothetical protein